MGKEIKGKHTYMFNKHIINLYMIERIINTLYIF
jgi:hypothetical protein